MKKNKKHIIGLFISRYILAAILLFSLISAQPAICSQTGAGLDNKDKTLIEIELLHTNDTHGNLQKPFDDGLTLLSFVSGYKNMIIHNKKDAGLLLVDAGDITSYKDVSFETMESDLRALDALGYHAMTIGNHEIDFGLYKFYELSKTVKMPILCSNIIDRRTGGYLFKPYIVKTFGKTRIAIAGITASNTFTALSDEEKNKIIFLGTDEAYLKILPDLKANADIIILLSHLGLPEDREFAKRHPEVKLIIGGHSHTFLNQAEYAGKTCILNAGKFGDCFGRAKIKIDGGQIVSIEESLNYMKKSILNNVKK